MLHKRFVPVTILVLLVALTLVLTVAEKTSAFPQDSPVNWRTDFEQARAEAKTQNKPLFVCFR